MARKKKTSETEQAREPALRFDVVGKVRNTEVPLKRAFLPVFEAVANSIHATQDRFSNDVRQKGEVIVTVFRDPQTESLPEIPARTVAGIERVTIKDNGVGFNDANMDAFETADTTAKANRGGKGVGRFSWLVVFREAQVRSTFEEKAGAVALRKFAFRATSRGIEDYEEGPAETTQLTTEITLRGPAPHYYEHLRKGLDVISNRIFEHCFAYFVMGDCPKVVVIDDSDGSKRIINDQLDDVIVSPEASIELKSGTFSFRHVRQPYSAQGRHMAHLCADRRVVQSVRLSTISGLSDTAVSSPDSSNSYIHHFFVESEVLDNAVDASRTRFRIPDEEPLLVTEGMIDKRTLYNEIGNHVNVTLQDEIESLRASNLERISSFIRTSKPQFRHLIGRKKEALEKLAYVDNERQLDEQLYRISQDYESEVRLRQEEVTRRFDSPDASIDRLTEELAKVIEQINEVGKANLVKYVAKRRAVIVFLERLLSKFESPVLEEHVHQLVFPMRATTDDTPYDEHNLWLVDDTLSFYQYIASDIALSKNPIAPAVSKRRPDLLAFKTGDPYQHVAIVEFKKPGRDDEDPVEQLIDYAFMLRDGKAVDVRGRPIRPVPAHVRIDGYAVVSMTEKMNRMMRKRGFLQKAVDEERWYGVMSSENVMIEVFDFEVLARRARQRNFAFFSKLGLA